jgi:hypothetical protein
MNRIELDFITPGARPGALSWLLLALGLLAFAVAALAWRAADADARTAESRLAGLSAAPVAKAAKTSLRADAAALARQRGEDHARRALALPWAALLTTLQASRPDDIALLELDADGRRGDFLLTAEAKSHQAMLAYYQLLQAEAGLRAVSLTRHELHEIDGVQGVNFSLRGEWSKP